MNAVEGFNHCIFRGGTLMGKFTLLVVGVATLAGVVVFEATTSRHVTAQGAAPIFVKKIPPGYRDWKVVSVAHEAGDLNDIRAVLGNDIAIKAYRESKLPFPEGAIVGRIAWSYLPSHENNESFGREQSFVAGSPTDAYLATRLSKIATLSSPVTRLDNDSL